MNVPYNAFPIVLKHGRIHITYFVAHVFVRPLTAIYICAFPRSGSTWLRTMLTSVMLPDYDGDPAVFNERIPGVTLRSLRRVFKAPKPRILSSHSLFRGSIPRAVYLVRDARHCVLSFYRYTTTRVGIHLSFDLWFQYYTKGYYGPRWDQHVSSWLVRGAAKLKGDLLIVRYEDFRTDTLSELRKVCDFLQISYTTEDLERAIAVSSVQNMKKWERKYVGEIKDPNASFYRGGKVVEWDTLVNRNQKRAFLQLSGPALQLAGYS